MSTLLKNLKASLKNSLKSAAIAALLLTAGAANAALLQFNLTGDYSASWQMNSSIVPDDGADGIAFVVYDVEGNFPGSVFGLSDLYFYHAAEGGGLEIYDYWGDNDLLVTDGPQLYTGSEEGVITFLLGSFALTDFNGPGTYTLTVTDLDAGPGPGPDPVDVPEPASAALLLGGLGLMFAAGKRRRRH
jgi:hypothetical protein